MPTWLTQTANGQSSLSDSEMAIRLLLALVCGCVIAGICRLVRPRNVIPPTFPATLVLLCILCAMLPQIIGQNVAWAFGLVGALSIVRFRTVIDDTKDIALVIFAVLVGMAVGAGRLPVAFVGMAVVGFASFLMKPRSNTTGWSGNDSMLTVRVGLGRDPESLLQGTFESHLDQFELLSGATSRQGAALDLVYGVRLRNESIPTQLIGELNRLDGIQSVELRKK